MLAPGSYGLIPVTEVTPTLLGNFRCGKHHLDQFLSGTATSYHQSRLGLTTVVVHPDFSGIVGYFTLSNDAVPLSDPEQFDLGLDDIVTLQAFPAVKIGRLAVAESLHGSGVSDAVMGLIVDQVRSEDSMSASRMLVTDADNVSKVIRYYTRNGFLPSKWAQDQHNKHTKKNTARTTVKMLRDILVPLES